ncbi:MAG: aconitase family protein [Planctomycetota bacterium]|jgi:3-isopropylmalate/(R)-2-methylmalate dehydratase large subunit
MADLISRLKQRSVEKRDASVHVEGRILFLVDDADAVRRQLAGEDLPLDHGVPYRDDISTDEITPAWVCYYFDETLGDFPYVGFRAGGEFPIERNSIRAGGFGVAVSGKRRGKGSSREASPYAEKCAGIQVVVAENIERIYQQNCHNLGLLTSTDFGVLARLRAGETIPLETFLEGKDPVTRQIVEWGGLFEFNLARLQGKVELDAPAPAEGGMTITEKIFARHRVVDLSRDQVGCSSIATGDAGFFRTDLRFSHEYVTPMASAFFEEKVGKGEPVNDPGSIVFFRDHLTFLAMAMTPERKAQGLLEVADQLRIKQEEFSREQGVTLHGETGHGGSEAICHSKILESYAEPGQLIIGSDSHTPHSGALGCVAFGVGTTAIFNSWITRDVYSYVPETVRVVCRGQAPAGITAKDMMLAILATDYVRDGKAIGKMMEYCGEAVEALSIDERATMTNMAAEVGAFSGIVAPDERTVEFLARERGMAPEVARELCAGLRSDDDARFVHTIEIDAAALRPLVATPGDPGNGVSIDEIGDVPIEIAYGGSCTAGKKEDMDMYARVLAHAVARGRKVAEGVEFWIQFGSMEVKKYCASQGYLDIFEKAGAQIIEPSCGACINAGPGVSRRPDQVTVSAINRNFPGRSGPGLMYLASPLTVAASAIEGRIVEWNPESVGSTQA